MKQQRVALITGCSEASSLGAAFALELRAKGWRVFVTARKTETLKALEAEGCDGLELDVVDGESVNAAAAHVTAAAGRLDLLINNAGVAALAPVLDLDIDRVKALYDVNVFGVLRVTQAFSDLLIKTANDPSLAGPKGTTTIINVASTARFIAPWQGAYGSAKAALSNISDSMRVEFAPLGIKVVNIDLSATQTAMAYQEKPFPITKAKPSPYFNYEQSILPSMRTMFLDFTKSAPTANKVAKRIIAGVDKRSPPARMILGASTWMFNLLFPLLTLSMLDKMLAKMMFVNKVQRPKF